jgi:hypothetical protein
LPSGTVFLTTFFSPLPQVKSIGLEAKDPLQILQVELFSYPPFKAHIFLCIGQELTAEEKALENDLRELIQVCDENHVKVLFCFLLRVHKTKRRRIEDMRKAIGRV